MRVRKNCVISYASVSTEGGVQFHFKETIESIEEQGSPSFEVTVGSFTCVQTQGKKRAVKFVAQVTEIERETDNVCVVFFTQSGGLKTFKYNCGDAAWVPNSDILSVLLTPTLNNRNIIFNEDIL